VFKFNTFLLLTHNFTTALRLHYNKVCFGDENATACTFNKCSKIVMVQLHYNTVLFNAHIYFSSIICGKMLANDHVIHNASWQNVTMYFLAKFDTSLSSLEWCELVSLYTMLM